MREGGGPDPLTGQERTGGSPALPLNRGCCVAEGVDLWGSAGPFVSLAKKSLCVLAYVYGGVGAEPSAKSLVPSVLSPPSPHISCS